MKIFSKFSDIINNIITKISDIKIFYKLIIAFIIIIIVPLSISFYISQKTANNMIVGQVSSETMSSIELVSNSIDSLIKKMSSMALYVNEDQSIKELITEKAVNTDDILDANPENINLNKLNRINKFNSIISNMAFNMMGIKCYITIITSTGEKFTNWPYEDKRSDAYLEKYMPGLIANPQKDLLWVGLEKNYIESYSSLHPYVITLAKNIFDTSGLRQSGTFIISVPEDEISKLLAPEDQLRNRAIVDENLKVISSTTKDWLNKPFEDIYSCEFPQKQQGYFILEDKNKEKSIISYGTVGNWKVVDIKSYDSITKQLDNSRNRLLIINAIFILFFFGISAVIARNISKPLRRLTKMMLKTDLESSYNEQVSSRNDEIGILERSFNVMRNNIKTLMQDNMDKEKRKRDAELKSLQAQISPHFLFNTLNAVRWAAINKNTKKAADMVLALSNLLRMTIVKGNELITVEEELENLKNYAAIFQMRHAVQFELSCNIEDDVKHYKIPKLLLQPLVENAIIHGFEGIMSGGLIEINSCKKDGFVIISVKDNGIGFNMDSIPVTNESKELKFSGIGVKNVDERIKLYFGEEYGLKITSSEGKGTIVEVRLPKQNGTEG